MNIKRIFSQVLWFLGLIFLVLEFYPPTQKTPAVKPGMNALDGPSEALPSSLPALTAVRQAAGRDRAKEGFPCFGGFRRRV